VISAGAFADSGGFAELAARQADLSAAASVAGLVARLRSRVVDVSERNRVYRLLILEAQRGGSAGRLARDVAWLGLWPALDRIWRQRVMAGDDPNEAASDVSATALELILTARLDQIEHVAATLVWNAERRLGEARFRRRREDAAVRELERRARGIEPNEEPVATMGLIGREARLVELVIVHGCRPRDLGCAAGVSRKTIERRLARGLRELRMQLVEENVK
jgi:DNA-directed RNA polymerase specialized sigma24 family protein